MLKIYGRQPTSEDTRTPFACTEVTRASFFAQTAQPSVGLIENEIRKSAKSVTPPLSMTSANLLKQNARNVGPVILIPESSMAYLDRNWRQSVSLCELFGIEFCALFGIIVLFGKAPWTASR
jgi:hypothetical protein